MGQKNYKKNKYKLTLNNKFINCLTLNGNKQISEKILLNTLKFLQQSSLKSSKSTLKFSLLNITPIIKIHQNKRKKRIINEIPFLLKPTSRINIAIKNIIKNTKKQSNNFFSENLKSEIINNLKKNSSHVTQKFELQNYALKKKSFTHFRWF